MSAKSPSNLRVCIVEDNDTLREGIEIVTRQLGFLPVGFETAEKALTQLRTSEDQLAIVDYKLPGMTGIDFIVEARKRLPALECILITAYGTIELAVEAMQKGAADFVTKPFSPDELRVKIAKVAQQIEQKRRFAKLQEENLYLRELEGSQFNFGEIIGVAPVMQEVFRVITKVAPTNSTVLIAGESGTGKELAARAIHKHSTRNDKPFIRVHCGALVETLLESELFGHEKGAFTGAIKRKRGRFELADGGTIFLDEIGEISPALQIRLLRVLQEQEFERVGGEETLRIDTRVIAATNRDIEAEVAAGRFREDLFYRLHVVPLYMPPLRQRLNDVPALIQHFIKKLSIELGKPNLQVTSEASAQLQAYHWPGNVRELENLLERAAVLCDEQTITPNDLPLLIKDRSAILALPEDELDLNKVMEEVERAMIERAMKKANGVKAEAARILGIKTTTLLYKLSKFEDSVLLADSSDAK